MFSLTLSKLRMFEPFLLDPDLKSTASQIAKKTKNHQKSTQLFLDSLENEGILKSKRDGKNKLFFFNKDNVQVVKNFMLSLEHLRTINFYKINPKIKQFIEKITAFINGSIVLFGSYANNSHNNSSDIDILIIGNYDEKKVSEVANTYNLDISIKHMEKYEENVLTREVQKNHIFLKNTELYISEAIEWIN